MLCAFLFAARCADGAVTAANVSPAQPEIPARTFNVKDYGAVGDSGATVNTDALARAVAAVKAAGGGTLVIPAGIYYTGPFDLCSNLNLRLEAGATLLFSPHFDDYRNAKKGFRPLLQINDAHDVVISGSGTINGNGEAWWPEARRFKAEANAQHARSNTSPRPTMVSFGHCQRIRVEGITLVDSPVFNLVQNNCSDVTVDGIAILNPADSPNTDGIDPKDCQRVLIAHCRIDTGDDCIALGGSSGTREEDILVTDCTFLHGHGCSIGSGTGSGLRNMLVRRCTFDGTDTGVRFKSARDRGGLVEDVTYEDLAMKNVGVAVSISSYYENSTLDTTLAEDKAEPVKPSTPHWRNITVRNLTATGGVKNAGLIAGLPELPAENIVLEHVTIEAPTGLHIVNARGVTLNDVHITVATGKDVIVGKAVDQLIRGD